MSLEPENDHELVDTEADKETGDVTVDLYNANHGKSPRTGGPYLDDVQARQAEVYRAEREGREPDLENPPADVGTVLVTKSQLIERDTDKSHFTDRVEVENEPVDSYVVPAEKNEPDPTQPNWDNDSTKVAALEASQRYDELRKNAESNASVGEATPGDFTPVNVENNTGTTTGDEEPDPNKPKETWE